MGKSIFNVTIYSPFLGNAFATLFILQTAKNVCADIFAATYCYNSKSVWL